MNTLRALAITDAADRPETGTFIGLHRAGVDLRVLLWEESAQIDWLRDAGVPYAVLRLQSKFDRAGRRAIRGHLAEHRPHITHLFRKMPIVNGLAAAKGNSTKLVLYRGIVGNISYLNPVDWMSFLNPRVDRIICVADAVRRGLLHLGGFGLRLPEERLVTIHKGHDLAWYQDKPADLMTVGVPEDAFVICCVTNVRPRKGVPLFVESLSAIPKDSRVHVLLIGNGMDSPPIADQIAKSPHRDRIHVLGYRIDAPSLMAAADVSVLPSLKREGLPRSVIEAMAYETTPVVSDSGGNPELVENGVSGLVVPAGDVNALGQALLSLYRDRDRCRQLGTQARVRIATDFRVEATVEKTLALYREIVRLE
jgi:glycosyltransferase involved in cell wall biosynthesis